MGDDDEGGAGLLVEVEEQLLDGMGGAFVEVAGGFVGEEQPGGIGEGAGQGDALLLAAGELGGIMVVALAEAHAFEQVEGFGARVAFALQFQGHHHVFEGSEGGQQLKILKDKAYLAVAQGGALVFAQGREVDPVDTHAA